MIQNEKNKLKKILEEHAINRKVESIEWRRYGATVPIVDLEYALSIIDGLNETIINEIPTFIQNLVHHEREKIPSITYYGFIKNTAEKGFMDNNSDKGAFIEWLSKNNESTLMQFWLETTNKSNRDQIKKHNPDIYMSVERNGHETIANVSLIEAIACYAYFITEIDNLNQGENGIDEVHFLYDDEIKDVKIQNENQKIITVNYLNNHIQRKETTKMIDQNAESEFIKNALNFLDNHKLVVGRYTHYDSEHPPILSILDKNESNLKTQFDQENRQLKEKGPSHEKNSMEFDYLLDLNTLTYENVKNLIQGDYF